GGGRWPTGSSERSSWRLSSESAAPAGRATTYPARCPPRGSSGCWPIAPRKAASCACRHSTWSAPGRAHPALPHTGEGKIGGKGLGELESPDDGTPAHFHM